VTPTLTAVVAGILGVMGAVAGLRAARWLRGGGHRYSEESGPLPRARWVPVACAVVAAGSAALWCARDLGDRPAYGIALALLVTPLIVLTAIDADVHRLPDRITIPLAAWTLVLVGVGALVDSPTAALRAVAAGVALGVIYGVMSLIGSGMGGGDVKLAPTVGLILGYLGWGAVLIGSLMTFLLAGLWGVALVVTRRATRKSNIAFGPFMVMGTVMTAWLTALTT